jgi:hypothetical protein
MYSIGPVTALNRIETVSCTFDIEFHVANIQAPVVYITTYLLAKT